MKDGRPTCNDHVVNDHAVVRWMPNGSDVVAARGAALLFSLLDAGLLLPFDCMQGHCGACRATLLGGTVWHAPAPGLSHEEREAGLVLLCASRPVSASVTLGPPHAHR